MTRRVSLDLRQPQRRPKARGEDRGPLFALTALLSTSLPLARGASCPTLRQPMTSAGVAAAEKLWIQNLESRDSANLACLLDEDFSGNSWTGAVRTRAEILSALPGQPASTIELHELKTRTEGMVGIATGLSILHDPCGTIVARTRFTDIFLFRDGRWRAIAAQETGLREELSEVHP
jgi:hypothetical protein